jgi:predicted RNA-binding protein with PUA-like domain
LPFLATGDQNLEERMAARKKIAKKPGIKSKKKSPQVSAGQRRSGARKPSRTKPAAKKSPASGSYATGPWAAAFAPRAEGERRYWLVKSEPSVFSFDDLLRTPGRTTCWDGVRNFAARNFLRDGMKLGDRVLFYHSMADPQSIAGICEVVREGYADHTALDPTHPHYDPGSDPTAPTWYMVDLRAVAQFTRPVTLPQIKARKELEKMALLRIGRLSVTPVTADEWAVLLQMAG